EGAEIVAEILDFRLGGLLLVRAADHRDTHTKTRRERNVSQSSAPKSVAGDKSTVRHRTFHIESFYIASRLAPP
ncbi:MAG: hypothetical protein M3Q15_04370, partial [Pseudomonadota bacterium]|nr:hypothetical protein [Pseudomonadota bacterium]